MFNCLLSAKYKCMPDLKTQISRLTEISLLLLALGFFVPISLFFFQQALLVIQLGLSHPKTLSDLANSTGVAVI